MFHSAKGREEKEGKGPALLSSPLEARYESNENEICNLTRSDKILFDNVIQSHKSLQGNED